MAWAETEKRILIRDRLHSGTCVGPFLVVVTFGAELGMDFPYDPVDSRVRDLGPSHEMVPRDHPQTSDNQS